MTAAAGREAGWARGEREALTDDPRVAFLERDGDGAFQVNED